MYRVFLVEDEAAVREGIVAKIDWNAHGFVLSGVFENGRQALAAFETEPADLVITDINMPVMDGLTLAKYINQLSPETVVVILTGYDDFSYAQTAIKYRVHEYILKPVTAKQLRELLDRLCAELRERDSRVQSQEELEQARSLMRRQVLDRLTAGTLKGRELIQRREEFSLQLEDGPCCAALFQPMVREEDRQRLAAELLAAVRLELRGLAAESYLNGAEQVVVLLSGREHCESLLREVAQGVIRSCRFDLSAAIGPVAPVLEAVSHSVQGAVEASAHLYRMEPGQVLSHDGLPRHPQEVHTGELRKSILRAIRQLKQEEALRELGNLHQLLAGSGLPGEECQGHLRRLAIALMELAEEDGSQQQESQDLLEQVYRQPSLQAACRCLRQQVVRLVEDGQHQGDSGSRQGARAVEYLEEHYANPGLSLQDVTSYLSVSTSHFSNLFKSYTGVTFVEYLTRLRMEKAQELLTATDKKNYEIAEAVGYDDPGYFSSTFKKFTGMKPTEYRKRYRG